MPLYEYECRVCYAHTDTFNSIVNRRKAPTCKDCGSATRLVISAVMGCVKFPAAAGQEYISPTSGKAITTERARRDDLKRTGCRPYEGFEAEKKEADKSRKEQEKKSDAKLEESTRRAYHQLSPKQRRVLETAKPE